ncbi:MAG: DNA alkylation repair protein [bacterium]
MKPEEFSDKLIAELDKTKPRSTAPFRKVAKKYSKLLKNEKAEFVLQVAKVILKTGKYRWVAYELIYEHSQTFQSLDRKKLETLGEGINSWWTVDSFARTLSGPAWLAGLISLDTIQDWAKSDDLWWRRAALVSTVALNIRTHGGKGDVKRTLAVCKMLVNDHEDMIVKALSWALRALVVHDTRAVREFLDRNQGQIAPRVHREVKNKLNTGLKNPRIQKSTGKGN